MFSNFPVSSKTSWVINIFFCNTLTFPRFIFLKLEISINEWYLVLVSSMYCSGWDRSDPCNLFFILVHSAQANRAFPSHKHIVLFHSASGPLHLLSPLPGTLPEYFMVSFFFSFHSQFKCHHLREGFSGYIFKVAFPPTHFLSHYPVL